MRIVALKQCDAWVPVTKGEAPVAGKRALFPEQGYTLPEGTQFQVPPAFGGHRKPGDLLSPEKAAKEGLIRLVKDKVAA